MSIFAPPITGSPVPAAETPPPDREIGSLWRRFIAFALDGIIIGLAGSAIALPFFDVFSRLGPWGRLVGFCLALPYFAILDSSVGNGQTIGKRLMHLQVVDESGTTISFWRSTFRYGIFAIPYYLNEMVLPVSRTPWIVFDVISVVVFGVGGATLYLMVFNRHARQGVHDLSVGSYVADADKSGSPMVKPIWKMHLVILGSLLVMLLAGTGIVNYKLTKMGSFPQLLRDVRVVEAMGGVQAAGVQDLTWNKWGGGDKKTILVVNVYWVGRSTDEIALADQVAKGIIEHDLKVKEDDVLRVVVIRGYDLGIAHAQVSNTYEHTPAEWNARLFGTSPPGVAVPTTL